MIKTWLIKGAAIAALWIGVGFSAMYIGGLAILAALLAGIITVAIVEFGHNDED